MAEPPTSEYNVVKDGTEDIAKRVNGEMMKVDRVGRHILRKAWLWTATKGKGSESRSSKYDPNLDFPQGLEDPSELPESLELVQHDAAKQYLEVGLVFGENPEKWLSEEGGGRNVEFKKSQKERGLNGRGAKMLRVFVPTTLYIKDQAKFWVGCKPIIDGRFTARSVAVPTVFFYPEIWEGLGVDSVSQKIRQPAFNKKCCELVAINKTKGPGQAAPIVANTTRAENLSPGVRSFMQFDQAWTDEDANVVAKELKATYKHFTPDTEFIKEIRLVLSALYEENEDGGFLSNCPAFESLGFILVACHGAVNGPDRRDAIVVFMEVRHAVEMAIALAHQPKTVQTASIPAVCTEDEDKDNKKRKRKRNCA